MNESRSRLIVALDVADRRTALDMTGRLSGHVGCFKLGLEIFVREGPRLVEEIRDRGEQIFLDLKLHDIPNTVAGAVRSACKLGVHMLTLHAAGGRDMLVAAREAAEAVPSPPLLLAVTALTSLSPQAVQDLGVSEGITPWVQRLAGLADQSGISGLVCSALELPLLRTRFAGGMKLVVPGIRPSGSAAQDQARIAAPGTAIRMGADFLVVGRPILSAPDPVLAADRITKEIEEAVGGMDVSLFRK